MQLIVQYVMEKLVYLMIILTSTDFVQCLADLNITIFRHTKEVGE
ncbi:hypothetical protein Javan636_0035 [Streptococcus phage Javan636]|nr:hypothetical protein Javan636_0035 [Streptococcus phage Javan636]